jgi:hypothetical protein
MARPHELIRAVARGEQIHGAEVTSDVAESAIEHRMVGLLLDSVSSSADIVDEVSVPLHAVQMAISARRREHDRVLSLVHRQLDEAGVIHTIVKGPASALRWFDKPVNRPYADLDVIVPAGEHFAKAVETLDPANPVVTLLGGPAAPYVSSVDVVVDGVDVDLQTNALRFGPTPKSDAEWNMGSDRLEEGVRVFDAEHDLVVFLLHQGRDRFRFLVGVAESRLRLKHPIDWDRVERIARAEGIWEQIAVALEVMCDELQIDTPVRSPAGWRSSFWRRAWTPDVRLLGETGRVRHIVRARWLMPLTMRGRVAEAAGWMLRSVFPPDALLRFRHPATRGPYLWRVVASRAQVIGERRLFAWRHAPD